MKKIPLLCVPFLMIGTTALADEMSYPKFSGFLDIELEDDWVYKSEDESQELNDLYPTITLGATLEFTKEFSFNFEGTAEPVEAAEENRAFEDQGYYVGVLTANYETDQFSVYGGKFTPNFGIAWYATPGLFGTDINEDYELAEMLGFGGSVNFDAAGEHTVSASIFSLDTSFLSDSFGTSRGPLLQSDGGATNTEDLSNFALALDGQFNAVEGFSYHAGFSALNNGIDGDKTQLGYVVGVQYELPISENFLLLPLAEIAYFDNADAIDGNTAKYATIGLGLNYDQWFGSATYQRRDTEISGVDNDDYIAAFSVGYAFDIGIEIMAGWGVAEEESVRRETLGLYAYYGFEF
ncbi:MAG: hypothetical protein V7723_04780 [Sneathiella sp.]|uniref:hypothetical protein n=1 Tax=Sneathiella sp. TaxID=1964365 RepID=UPI003003A3A0